MTAAACGWLPSEAAPARLGIGMIHHSMMLCPVYQLEGMNNHLGVPYLAMRAGRLFVSSSV